MNRKLLLALALCYSAFALNAQNLLINGGAEAGTAATGWTTVAGGTACATGFNGNWTVQGNQNGFPAARTGNYYFVAGCSSTQTEIYQNVDVSGSAIPIDNGTYQMTFSGWTRSYLQSPADEAEIVVEFRSGANAVLSSYSTGTTTNTAGWVRYIHTRFLPVNTRSVRVRLLGRTNAGPFQDAYFDDIALVSGANPLPVAISGFTSAQQNGSVVLRWTDERPASTTPYDVEWSRNGTDWQHLAEVSPGTGEYFYEHRNPAQGLNLYRIRTTDASGKQAFTSTLQERIGSESPLFTVANPASGSLRIELRGTLTTDAGEITLSSIDGKQLRRLRTSGPSETLDISNLASGLYVLRVMCGADQQVQRIEIRN